MFMTHNILYSYRRCPYAMRARMALVNAAIPCEVHEISFRDKPAHMLEISPKGTVPVLQITNGCVIDESLDIVYWAFAQHDPAGWVACDMQAAQEWIEENDGPFKAALDRYKYPGRFPSEDCSGARASGLSFLHKLEEVIGPHILGPESIADICIFPFVRQFAHVDKEWFEKQDLPKVKEWLQGHLNSELFQMIFKKHKESPYPLLG